MGRRLKREERDELERLLDQTSLNTILDALTEICYEKASHIDENWQDKSDTELIKAWNKAGNFIGDAADKIDSKIGELP